MCTLMYNTDAITTACLKVQRQQGEADDGAALDNGEELRHFQDGRAADDGGGEALGDQVLEQVALGVFGGDFGNLVGLLVGWLGWFGFGVLDG